MCKLSPLGCSFQLTVEMFDYLECELNLFQTGEWLPSLLTRLSGQSPGRFTFGPAFPCLHTGWHKGLGDVRALVWPFQLPP